VGLALQELGAEVLHSAAVLAKLLLSQNKEAPPEALQQAAELLHDHGILVRSGWPLCCNYTVPSSERLTAGRLEVAPSA
jgi:hypothetical protein